MMKLMSLEFPLSKDIMTTVRLVTGGIGALVGFGIDEAEDCKVCITEGLLLLLHGGAKSAHVRFEKEERLEIILEGDCLQAELSPESEISVALLSALVDDLDIHGEKGLTRISFGFGQL